MSTIQINNAEFYYELHGTGQPLVLVSGYASDHCTWYPLLPKLIEHFQVLVFDNRASGQTKDAGTFSLTTKIMADDVMALIKALKLEKPHVAGQSMGGTIVQNLAAHHSDELSKIVIVSSTAKWRQATLLGIKTMIEMRRQNCSFEAIFECIISWVYGETFLADPEKINLLRSLFLNNPYPQSLANQERQYAALIDFDSRNDLHKIKNSTLAVYGTEDILSLPDESKAIAAGITNAKLVEFKCGHAITDEMSQELAELLLDFLKD